jgi:hypothetical protein
LVQLSILQTPIALNFGKFEIETKSLNPASARTQISKRRRLLYPFEISRFFMD